MPKFIRPTELRSKLFTILDEIIESGEPYEIERKGRRLLIMPLPLPQASRLERPFRNALACTFDELVETHFDYEPGEDP